jgi:hypothetical protein
MKQHDDFHPDEIDPRLFELLDQLRHTPPRDPEAVERGRMKFQAEMNSLGLSAPTRSQGNFLSRGFQRISSKGNNNDREDLLMNNRKQRFTLASAVILIILLAFLFGGAGMTALASQASLPGDVLYPVKTSLEQTRVALARDASVRAQLQMEFAERRLGEIAGLIEEGRFDNIPTATAEFETYIRHALAELEAIAQGDPEQATILAVQVSEALTRHALTLSGMLDQVPESVRLEMRRALQNTQETGKTAEVEFTGIIERIGQDSWVIAGRAITMNTATEMKGPFVVGDVVKVHAFQNADGSLSAREIERLRAGQSGDENENGNGNTISNANANETGNLNSNLDANDNSNANLDDSNSNANENQNRVQNQNQNLNQNQNDNMGSENLNQNLNQNQNDNLSLDQNQNQNQTQNKVQNQNQNENSSGNQDDNQNQNQEQNQNHNSNDNDD